MVGPGWVPNGWVPVGFFFVFNLVHGRTVVGSQLVLVGCGWPLVTHWSVPGQSLVGPQLVPPLVPRLSLLVDPWTWSCWSLATSWLVHD